MSEGLLTILKFCFLGVLWLFFVRVVRVAWAEVHSPPAPAAPPGPSRGAPAPAPAPAAAQASGPVRATILQPAERRGRSYELGQDLTIGRDTRCQISLPEDSTVSQNHARIYRRDGRLWLEDLGSTNGTYVNSNPVSSPVILHKGDRIQLGRAVLEVNR
ncbi:MAG TPA: FHA domain-containing protein [Acidimicrobiales bacterium]|nr:FHA domain-containing protein [Acidimicrobiales bacterium]